VTSNDYGVDLEVEIVDGEEVIGKVFKAQVKSSQKVIPRRDGIPTVSGIKQTTLNYWIELSFHSHLVAFLVDLETEKIYLTEPIFWQALRLISGTDGTKTIEFCSSGDTPNSNEELVSNILSKINTPSVFEQIYCHKLLLQSFTQILSTYRDCAESDYDSEITIGNKGFDSFLLACKVLLHGLYLDPKKEIEEVKRVCSSGENQHFYIPRELNDNDINNLLERSYYDQLSNHCYPDINCKDALLAFIVFFPRLGEKLKEMREVVLSSKKVWIRRDLEYLKLVFSVDFPERFDYVSLMELLNDFENSEDPLVIERSAFGKFICE